MKIAQLTTYFICLCLFSILSQGATKKPGAYLSDRIKKQYSGVDYKDLKIAPKRFKNKNLKMEFVFEGSPSDISSFYKSRMPEKRYFYFRIDEYYEGAVPVITSRRSRKNIITKLLEMDNGSIVTVYGKIKKLARRRRDQYHNHRNNFYYFEVVDLDSGSIADNAPKDELGEKSEAKKESDYKKIKTKNIDLLANNYIGKKIAFVYHYQGRNPEITYYLKALFKDDKYFQLETGDYYNYSQDEKLLAGFSLIGNKSNMGIIEPLLELENGDPIVVYGTLNKYKRTHYEDGKIQYYILIDKLRPAQKKRKKSEKKHKEKIKRIRPVKTVDDDDEGYDEEEDVEEEEDNNDNEDEDEEVIFDED